MRLVSIKTIPKETCYDLEVSKNRNFFANGLCVHNTNAAVAVGFGSLWFQSRENIITCEQDNAGFAAFATTMQDTWYDIAALVVELFDATETDTTSQDIAIFGEWCGRGIQKGVAISELPKMFVVFGIALVDSEGDKTYLTREQVEYACAVLPEQIKCIYDFPTYELLIDFENPSESQNKLNAVTEAVEAECPVGKAFGVTGVGEGVVWRCVEEGYEDSGYWFKVKGSKHSQSKVKTLATVDCERINTIKELADRLAHNGRLEQQHQQVFDTLNGGQTDMTKMGDFIKAVMADIFKEDADIIAASGFTGKEISQPVFNLCRKFIAAKL